MSHRLEYTKEIIRPERKETDGFDYPGSKITYRLHGLLHFDCARKYPYGSLTKLYARVGLHRYNLLEGTNLQFHSLKSFNMKVNCGASPYYITLDAIVPGSPLPQTFQVLVHEGRLCCLDLICTVARPRVITKEPFQPRQRTHGSEARCATLYVDKDKLPNWPSEISFNDTSRFHLVKGSEMQENDCIRLYLELALVTNKRFTTDQHLSQLKIVQVAIEDVESPNAKTSIFYIMYEDLAKAWNGEPVARKAIVRRVLNELTGDFTLRGLWSGQTSWKIEIEPMHLPGREKAEDYEQRSKNLRRRLGVLRPWRLSNPRCHQVFKNRGLHSSD